MYKSCCVCLCIVLLTLFIISKNFRKIMCCCLVQIVCVCVCGWQQMKALKSSSNIKQQTSSYRIYALYTSLYWRENKFTECIVHIYNYLHCFYIRCVFFIFRSFLLLFFLLLLFDEKHIGFGVDFKGVWIKNKAKKLNVVDLKSIKWDETRNYVGWESRSEWVSKEKESELFSFRK